MKRLWPQLTALLQAWGRALVLIALAGTLALGPQPQAWAALNPQAANLQAASLQTANPQAASPKASSPEFDVAVVEHIKLKVPEEARQAWLEAERQSWEPWLARQSGFLSRELLWDSSTEEGTLLIRWASREQWKAIPHAEIEAVQQRFEQLARRATGSGDNPFPVVFEGELLPP
jgi:uncharacterized protein (TIGR03792 family)